MQHLHKTYTAFDVYDQLAIKNVFPGGSAAGHTVTITLGGVSGVSAQAIVIWRERNVWKRHTLDTILPVS